MLLFKSCVNRLTFLQVLNSGNDMTTEDIVQRIIRHRLDYEDRNSRKEQKEMAVVKALQNLHAKQNGEHNDKMAASTMS